MTPARRVKDAILERYLADALSAELRAQVEATLADSEADRLRVAELRADSEAFLVSHPPGQMVARYERQRRRRWFGLPVILAPLTAAAAVAVFLVGRPPEPEVSVKGTMALVVHLRQGDSSVEVQEGQPLKPKDAVRFKLVAAAQGYVAVLSRDSAGTVTVYYPYAGSQPAVYDPRAPELPTAIELDATTGVEHLYALYSPKPFELSSFVEALRSGRPPQGDLQGGVEVAHRTLLKR